MHVYEVRPRKDHRSIDLISDGLPFVGLWFGGPREQISMESDPRSDAKTDTEMHKRTVGLANLRTGLKLTIAFCCFRFNVVTLVVF